MPKYTYIITFRHIQYYFVSEILITFHVKGLDQLFSFLAVLKINSMISQVDQRLLFSSRIWILNSFLFNMFTRGIYAINISKK